MIAAHNAVMTEIVLRTAHLYGIQPRPAAIVMGPAAGTIPAWSPVYVPEWRFKTVMINGKKVDFKVTRSYAGITLANGSVELDDNAFKYSPGYLAAVIFHESIHFEQITTKGRGDVINDWTAETEAHSADCGTEAVAAFRLTATEKAEAESAFTSSQGSPPQASAWQDDLQPIRVDGSDDDGGDAFWSSAQSGAALELQARAGNAANAALQAADREAKLRRDQQELDAQRGEGAKGVLLRHGSCRARLLESRHVPFSTRQPGQHPAWRSTRMLSLNSSTRT